MRLRPDRFAHLRIDGLDTSVIEGGAHEVPAGEAGYNDRQAGEAGGAKGVTPSSTLARLAGTPMVSVTARKIRDHGAERTTANVGRVYTGYLISYPYIGRGMVIFRDP